MAIAKSGRLCQCIIRCPNNETAMICIELAWESDLFAKLQQGHVVVISGHGDLVRKFENYYEKMSRDDTKEEVTDDDE